MMDSYNNQAQKNALTGLLSLIASIISMLGLFMCMAMAGHYVMTEKGQDSPEIMITGLMMFLFAGAAVVSIVLGCVGLCAKNKKKMFSIIGIVTSTLALTILGLLIFIGLRQGRQMTDPTGFKKPLHYEYHYKYIPPENVKIYLEVEAFWKKVHLKAMADNTMLGWVLCKIEPSDQQNIQYNFVTINIYDSMEGVQQGSGSTEKFNDV